LHVKQIVSAFSLKTRVLSVFAPFVAYAIARVSYPWRRNTSPLILVFLVALIAVPVIDLIWSIQARPNQTRLETLRKVVQRDDIFALLVYA